MEQFKRALLLLKYFDWLRKKHLLLTSFAVPGHLAASPVDPYPLPRNHVVIKL